MIDQCNLAIHVTRVLHKLSGFDTRQIIFESKGVQTKDIFTQFWDPSAISCFCHGKIWGRTLSAYPKRDRPDWALTAYRAYGRFLLIQKTIRLWQWKDKAKGLKNLKRLWEGQFDIKEFSSSLFSVKKTRLVCHLDFGQLNRFKIWMKCMRK